MANTVPPPIGRKKYKAKSISSDAKKRKTTADIVAMQQQIQLQQNKPIGFTTQTLTSYPRVSEFADSWFSHGPDMLHTLEQYKSNIQRPAQKVYNHTNNPPETQVISDATNKKVDISENVGNVSIKIKNTKSKILLRLANITKNILLPLKNWFYIKKVDK